jgi:hypothetical protein
VRTDAESVVIVFWVVFALVLLFAVIYSALATGDWLVHVVILVAGELLLAGLGRLALRVARPR